MHRAQDGRRTLEFDGILLAQSTSWRPQSPRWVEFKIYHTTAGMYVVSRTGASATYHAPTCYIVSKYRLIEKHPADLRVGATPCTICTPTQDLPYVFPEEERNWAQSFQNAETVIEALYQYNEAGVRYLTRVAQQAIEQAAKKDDRIEAAYRIEHVP